MLNNLFKVNKGKVVLYSGEDNLGYNHLNYWIPEFVKSGIAPIILTRNNQLKSCIKNDFRRLDIICAKSAIDVESFLKKRKNISLIFYMSNAGNNIHLLRFYEYQHIFIGTEYFDRDAKVTKMLRAYDELWLTSQASVDKIKPYFDISEIPIKLIGKPQLKDISKYCKKTPKTVLLKLSALSFEIKSFLDILSTLSKKENIIDIYLSYDIEKINPFAKNIKEQLSEYILFNHSNCNIIDAVSVETINRYEMVICDVYTYDYRFLTLDTKIYIYIKKNENISNIFLDKYISIDGLYRFDSATELEEILEKGDFMKEKREAHTEYWMGKKNITHNQFQNNLKDIV